MSNLDKLKAMFPHASASTLKLNPEFGATCGSSPGLPNDALAIYLRAVAKPRSKYGNVKVEYEGLKFDSKHELECWKQLKVRMRAREISELKRQVRFDLEVNGRRTGKITVDFTWMEDGQLVVADAKSDITRKERSYRMKKKHFEAQFAPLVICEL